MAPSDASFDRAELFDANVAVDAGVVDVVDVAQEAAMPPPTREEILGTSWRRLMNAPSIAGKQDDVYFINPRVGWSINGQGRLFHTDDGGDTWTRLINQPGTYFRAVTFLDENRGFIANIGPGYYPGVTDNVPLYMTTNGGVTITPVESITGDRPTGICNFNLIDSTHIVATGRVGGPSFFLHSEDAGETWASTNITDQISMLVDAHFANPMEGWVTGASVMSGATRCVILHTTNGGESWETAFRSTNPGKMCWKMSFPSAQVGYAAVLTLGTTTSSFIKTTDGGVTWRELPFVMGSYAALGVGFITDDIGWIGGETASKPVYRTTDGGETWTPDMSIGPYINRFRFVGNRTGYAIGSTIYKFEIP
jgi:photosystem II stability/assembly factor-like uncharacterized protein